MSDEPLQVTITIIAPKGRSEQVASTLRPMLGSVRARSGCLGCHIYRDVETPEEVVLLQEWENEKAFSEHVESREYRYILEWIEMSSTRPKVTVYRRPSASGLEYIKRLIAGKLTADRTWTN
ncbi:MAG: antibiotic biosynthesis monooxygenase family protein [Gammaproteobacteria bacterium]|nr:antibiotic biosynthesis monooxygenase family protein [Gammaproteobacteria bacterium]